MYYIAKYRSSASYCNSTFSPHTKSCEISTVFIPILQIRKVKHKKIIILSSNRRAHKWQNWDSTKFFFIPRSQSLNYPKISLLNKTIGDEGEERNSTAGWLSVHYLPGFSATLDMSDVPWRGVGYPGNYFIIW